MQSVGVPRKITIGYAPWSTDHQLSSVTSGLQQPHQLPAWNIHDMDKQ